MRPLVVSWVALVVWAILEPCHAVDFADPHLEEAVRISLGKPSGPLRQEDLRSLKRLDAVGKNVGDLAGIERLENLNSLDLMDNHIRDLTPLSGLVGLAVLNLSNNYPSGSHSDLGHKRGIWVSTASPLLQVIRVSYTL